MANSNGQSPNVNREARPQSDTPTQAPQEHSTADYAKFMPQLRRKKKWPRVVGWTLVIVIILAGLGLGAHWLLNHKSKPKSTQTTHQATTAQNSNKPAVATQSYDSNNFNLSFNYPANWTVADKGNGKLTVTSPPMQLVDATSQPQTGQVVMSIQNQDSADMSMFTKGSAAAVLKSQKVAYAKPTSNQRADTHLSFLQYATTTTTGALDGIYITGDLGYTKGQVIPESDIAKVDPLVRVTFAKCANANCTGATTPLSINATMWSTANFSDPIEAMLKSLAFQ